LLGSYFWLFSKDAPPRIGFTRSPWKIFPVTATNASGICDKACILALVSPLGHFKIVAWKHEDITKYPSFQKTRNYKYRWRPKPNHQVRNVWLTKEIEFKTATTLT